MAKSYKYKDQRDPQTTIFRDDTCLTMIDDF
jgi:hypothetical protein